MSHTLRSGEHYAQMPVNNSASIHFSHGILACPCLTNSSMRKHTGIIHLLTVKEVVEELLHVPFLVNRCQNVYKSHGVNSSIYFFVNLCHHVSETKNCQKKQMKLDFCLHEQNGPNYSHILRCEIWSSHSSAAENSGLLGYYTISSSTYWHFEGRLGLHLKG